jgi:thiol-disulfide isomerase/thioredoxin
MNNQVIIIIAVILLVISYYIGFSEKFSGSVQSSNNPTNKPAEVLVFLSKSCPHCITFRSDTLPTLSAEMKQTPHGLNIVVSDEDKDNLFSKYSIKYVPACVIVKDGKEMTLNGQIIYDNIMKNIKSM